MRNAGLAAAALLLAGCKSEESDLKAIIGAVLIDGSGGAPVSDSVVIVAGTTIRSAGLRANIPIPASARKFDGRGKFLAPALVESSGTDARAPVPIRSLEQARQAVTDGSKSLAGMIVDTESLDAAWLAQLRALGVVFTPSLASLDQRARGMALRNTARLATAGVKIAIVARSNQEREREIGALVEAGLAPMDVVLAVTRHAALAGGSQDQAGTIEPGRKADLMLLARNPLEDPSHMARPERIMRAGEWTEP